MLALLLLTLLLLWACYWLLLGWLRSWCGWWRSCSCCCPSLLLLLPCVLLCPHYWLLAAVPLLVCLTTLCAPVYGGGCMVRVSACVRLLLRRLQMLQRWLRVQLLLQWLLLLLQRYCSCVLRLRLRLRLRLQCCTPVARSAAAWAPCAYARVQVLHTAIAI